MIDLFSQWEASWLKHVFISKQVWALSIDELTVEDNWQDEPLDYSTNWGRVSYVCVGKLIIIGSDNGLSPGRRQAIFWTYARTLLIRPQEKNFNDILIEIHTSLFHIIHF